MKKDKKIFLIHATMGDDLYLYVKAKNKEEVRDWINDEVIDGGDMIRAGAGCWAWGDIDEIDTEESINELNGKLLGNDPLKKELM